MFKKRNENKGSRRGSFIQPTKRSADVAFSVIRDLQPDMLEKKGLSVESADAAVPSGGDGFDVDRHFEEQEARVRDFIVGLYPQTTREGILYLAIISVVATATVFIASLFCFEWNSLAHVLEIIASGLVPGLLLSCALAHFMVLGEVGKQRTDKMTGEKTPAPDRFSVVSFVIVLAIALCMGFCGTSFEVGGFGGDAFVATVSRTATICVVVAELVLLVLANPVLNTNFNGLCILLGLRSREHNDDASMSSIDDTASGSRSDASSSALA